MTRALLFALLIAGPAWAQAPQGHPSAEEAGRMLRLPENVQLRHSGHVLEAIDSNAFTYIRIASEEGERWLSAPQIAVKPGMLIRFGEGRLFNDFYSRKQNRKFASITFVDRVEIVGSAR
jgi:hypothetical protein